jgi:hypothetical protein
MNRRVLANLHDGDRDLVRLVLKTCLTKKKMKKWMDARKVDLLKVFYFYLPFFKLHHYLLLTSQLYEFSLRETKKGHS